MGIMLINNINPKYHQYILIICLFFFLNVYLLYNTASNTEVQKRTSTPIVKKPILHDNSLNVGKCEITDELALSALKRVKSSVCRAKIEKAACDLQKGTFHDEFPESQCPNHDHLLIDFAHGCYSDSINGRLLTEFQYKFPKGNSRQLCRKHCYRAGFLLYGLEYGEECFCGNQLANNATKIEDEKCENYKCPGNVEENCGGFNAIWIARTGLKNKVTPVKPKFVNETPEKLAKILYVLQLNGRNERQVIRFLKSIYSEKHNYIIHVDKRQHYMYSEMSKIAENFENIRVTDNRFSTIWGGASLLQMFLQIIRDNLDIEWDYIVNFSESDFPILPVADFENLISSNMGFSYLASHGYNTARFLQKQGFDFVFLECEERMWRIGKRDFPANIRIDGGSDWVGIHRDLAEYSISENQDIPIKMRKLFESILLPLESFYHTLSFNSRFCDRILSSNLRLTNWYRKQGCRCAGLKKVVDWCGCSPLVFRNETIDKFEIEKVKAKPSYFARKFDSIVNIDAISLAEKQSVPEDKLVDIIGHPSYHSAFSNVYKKDIDGESIALTNFGRSILELSEIVENFEELTRIDVFRAHSKAPIQIVVSIKTSSGESQFLVDRVRHVEIFKHSSQNGFLLKNLTFGTRYEYKEELCREYIGIITNVTTVQLRIQWNPVEVLTKKVEKTSPEVEIRWKTPQNEIFSTHRVKPYDSSFGGQFDEVDLSQKLPSSTSNSSSTSCSSEYSVDVFSSDPSSPQLLATLHFPVYPFDNPNCHLELTRKFFDISDFCKNTEECQQKVWSISFPDPKSQF